MDKPNVLIVEDNKINALVLQKTIKDYCEPTHVTNDEQTFEAIANTPFEIIFMDINLGSKSKDGEEIMKIIRQDPRYQHIKIFAVTSYAMPGDRERFLKAGFDRYFSKPIQKNAIIKEVEHTLGQKI